MMSLSNEKSIDDHNSNSNSSNSSTTEYIEPSSLNEQQTPKMTTTNVCNHHYCLIIFNNPKWSQPLRKRSEQTAKQQPQQTQCATNQSEGIIVKNENQDVSLDDQFPDQLRQLLNDYMQHTTRPFPIKYFLDFTDH